MLQLIKFFINNKTGLLFVFLEFIALSFIIRSHTYHHSKYLNSANALSGSLLKKSNTISNYFSLKEQNELLTKENKFLLKKLQISKDSVFIDPIDKQDLTKSKYEYITARVISNPYTKRNNILTIDKGSLDSIKPNMGVVLANGVIGITLKVSRHYATVMSLLNSHSKINAKMVKSHHYGSLHWEGEDFTKVSLDDLPIQATIKIGDTIISGGKSVFFPEGIPIGIISDFEIENKAYKFVTVDLFADFSELSNVYVVKNKLMEEQLNLESESLNE